MSRLIRSYLSYARGDRKFSPWMGLVPLELITRAVVGVRNFAFDHGLMVSCEPPLPTISVGNITLGGTNKTPFVEMLARKLLECGIRPGIVSRGYGGNTLSPVVVEDGDGDRDIVGDEPLLLSSRLPGVPVAVSRDRLMDVDVLAGRGVEVVVADDAFQHRRLGRDVDIVLVDASCAFGNGRLVPAGILREPPSALKRAHMVVITKSDQVPSDDLDRLRNVLSRWVSPDRLFSARLGKPSWQRWRGRWSDLSPKWLQQGKKRVVAFSAIGSPRSFRHSVESQGIDIADEYHFKDHHRYDIEDMRMIGLMAEKCGADAVVCTEKDIYNLPAGWTPDFELVVPRISTILDDASRFWMALAEALRPEIVVASNGYGEDAIGSLLADRIRSRLPQASVLAFPLVGEGEHYRKRGIPVASAPSTTPTGGVIKYRLIDLWTDLRSGLLGHIVSQLHSWQRLRGNVRTPICVGDVYLFLHTLWGQGRMPLVLATAKTIFLNGHWRAERYLLRKRCRRVWTRDAETASELVGSGVKAVFAGNPIMDLIGDNKREERAPWPKRGGKRVLLLPGSRQRAYDDIGLLLKAAKCLSGRIRCTFLAVIAPTLEMDRLLRCCEGWKALSEKGGLAIGSGDVKIALYSGSVADAARDADILIGLGGTANQVCAGLGVPVISIQEKGKAVQKRLLGDSEILVSPRAEALAEAALDMLSSPDRLEFMSKAGIERLGMPGALDDILEHVSEEMGWKLRCEVYSRLKRAFS